MSRTQQDRVLAAARSFRGVCQTDFLLPDVVDGGPPITRLAARINELDAQGYSFECLGWRDKTKVWRLVGVGGGSGSTEPSPPSLPAATSSAVESVRAAVAHQEYVECEQRLFEAGKPERPHWDEAAA